MTDEEMYTDKGEDWKNAHAMVDMFDASDNIGGDLLEAMHDRDRYMAERDMWREEAQQTERKLIELQEYTISLQRELFYALSQLADETWRALS